MILNRRILNKGYGGFGVFMFYALIVSNGLWALFSFICYMLGKARGVQQQKIKNLEEEAYAVDNVQKGFADAVDIGRAERNARIERMLSGEKK